MESTEKQYRRKMFLAFGLLYFFWGSTYLGIRIAVEDIPPALMAGVRFFIAGPLMLLWCARRGYWLAFSWHDGVRLAVVGVLLLSIGNVVVNWAEQWVPSGLAALIISITPMWFLILETWIFPRRQRVSPARSGGAGDSGACGIVVLLWPELVTLTAWDVRIARQLKPAWFLLCLGSRLRTRQAVETASGPTCGYRISNDICRNCEPVDGHGNG